jgi:hypothetical protein
LVEPLVEQKAVEKVEKMADYLVPQKVVYLAAC